MCKENGCKKQPSFNKERETKGIYCNAHKKDGMVNVKEKMCIHLDCIIRPSFNKAIKVTAPTKHTVFNTTMDAPVRETIQIFIEKEGEK